MLIKCYNKTHNKALRDGNLKGLLINNSLSGVVMTNANNTRNIERGQSRTTKLTYGVGFNSKIKHKVSVNGKMTKSYNTWHCMMQRSYDPKYHLKRPTYIDCVVDDRWHDFQDFADWYESHNYSELGFALDKDILVPNNKIYSPETCCFLPQEINKLLNDRRNARGLYPQGVIFHKILGRYQAQINLSKTKKHLGYFDCPQEAHQVYKKTKEAYVKEKALEWQGQIADDAFQALMSWTLDT